MRALRLSFLILIAAMYFGDAEAVATNIPKGFVRVSVVPESGCAYGPGVYTVVGSTTNAYTCIAGTYVQGGGGGGGAAVDAANEWTATNLFSDGVGIGGSTSAVKSTFANTTGDLVMSNTAKLCWGGSGATIAIGGDCATYEDGTRFGWLAHSVLGTGPNTALQAGVFYTYTAGPGSVFFFQNNADQLWWQNVGLKQNADHDAVVITDTSTGLRDLVLRDFYFGGKAAGDTRIHKQAIAGTDYIQFLYGDGSAYRGIDVGRLSFAMGAGLIDTAGPGIAFFNSNETALLPGLFGGANIYTPDAPSVLAGMIQGTSAGILGFNDGAKSLKFDWSGLTGGDVTFTVTGNNASPNVYVAGGGGTFIFAKAILDALQLSSGSRLRSAVGAGLTSGWMATTAGDADYDWFHAGGFQLHTPGSKPSCDSTARGLIYYTAGGAGVADKMEKCVKDAADAYAWVAF